MTPMYVETQFVVSKPTIFTKPDKLQTAYGVIIAMQTSRHVFHTHHTDHTDHRDHLLVDHTDHLDHVFVVMLRCVGSVQDIPNPGNVR